MNPILKARLLRICEWGLGLFAAGLALYWTYNLLIFQIGNRRMFPGTDISIVPSGPVDALLRRLVPGIEYLPPVMVPFLIAITLFSLLGLLAMLGAQRSAARRWAFLTWLSAGGLFGFVGFFFTVGPQYLGESLLPAALAAAVVGWLIDRRQGRSMGLHFACAAVLAAAITALIYVAVTRTIHY
jgi:hypothetical protein